VGFFINDTRGTSRIKICIDKENNPKIELLDEEGESYIEGIESY